MFYLYVVLQPYSCAGSHIVSNRECIAFHHSKFEMFDLSAIPRHIPTSRKTNHLPPVAERLPHSSPSSWDIKNHQLYKWSGNVKGSRKKKNISMINHEYIMIIYILYIHIHNKYLERYIMYIHIISYYTIVHINEQTQLHSITSSNTMLDENNNLMARSCMYRQLRPGYEKMHWLPRHRPTGRPDATG